jgi:hypothetical protein
MVHPRLFTRFLIILLTVNFFKIFSLIYNVDFIEGVSFIFKKSNEIIQNIIKLKKK